MQNALVILSDILLQRPVFEKNDGNWVDVLPKITKQYNNTTYSSIKMTPTQASLKKNEGFVYQNFLNKRMKMKQKYKNHDIVRTADLKRTFSKRDTTNWSYKFYKITEIFKETIRNYRIANLPERYSEALLKKTELTLKVNKDVMKTLNLN